MIITGAPVETLEYNQVDYWDELCEIMEWSRTHVYSSLHICWGAQAGLYFHYGVKKHPLEEKLSGVYGHKPLDPSHPLLPADDVFCMPHSVHRSAQRGLGKSLRAQILAESDKAGVALIATATPGRYMLRLQYDHLTLLTVSTRHQPRAQQKVPENYFQDDDPENACGYVEGHANMLFSNWLNYFVSRTLMTSLI